MPAQAPIRASRQPGAFMGDEDWPTDLEANHLEGALRLVLVCGILVLAVGLGLILCVHLLCLH